jgi:hypothetical protein
VAIATTIKKQTTASREIRITRFVTPSNGSRSRSRCRAERLIGSTTRSTVVRWRTTGLGFAGTGSSAFVFRRADRTRSVTPQQLNTDTQPCLNTVVSGGTLLRDRAPHDHDPSADGVDRRDEAAVFVATDRSRSTAARRREPSIVSGIPPPPTEPVQRELEPRIDRRWRA